MDDTTMRHAPYATREVAAVVGHLTTWSSGRDLMWAVVDYLARTKADLHLPEQADAWEALIDDVGAAVERFEERAKIINWV